MTFDELLLGLIDIQPPPEPGWWPLATVWWILLLTFSFGVVIWLLHRKRQSANRLLALAHQDLQKIKQQYRSHRDSSILVQNLSRWLRQVAIAAFPDRGIAAVTGRDWLFFLDENLDSSEFSEGAGKAFGAEVYRPQPQINADQLLILCDRWLQMIKTRPAENHPVLKGQGRI